MIGQDMVNRLYDCQVIDPEGEKIGSVKRIWLDGQTGDPVWASVHTGLFGLRETFVPLQRAELHDDRLQVPVGKAKVKEAPRIEAEGDQMSDEEQQTLYQYYGVSPSAGSGDRHGDRQGMSQPGSVQRSAAGGRHGMGQQSGVDQRPGMGQPGQRDALGRRGNAGQPGTGREGDMGQGRFGQHDGAGQRRSGQRDGTGQRRSGQGDGTGQREVGRGDGAGQLAGDLSTSDARQGPGSEGMTRSEERLHVGTEQVETGRVRLVKHVVTEEQEVSVPVSHEEVRIEREPVTDASGMAKAEISEGEQEDRLHAEKPVVRKETVPLERVRLATDTITEQETVSGEVRKEQIDIEDDQSTGRGRNKPSAR